MGIKGDLIAIGAAGVVLIAAGWYAKKKLGDAAGAIGQAAGNAWDAAVDASKYVNPASADNVAYQGASSFTRWLTGEQDKNQTIGTMLYDFVHRDDYGPTSTLSAAEAARQAEAVRRMEAGFHGM